MENKELLKIIEENDIASSEHIAGGWR